MLESERKYIARQYNYNRVPHPLLEGLVFVGIGNATESEMRVMRERIEQRQQENEAAKTVDSN